ncbi:CBN-BTB-15 protein [Caenorhabditis brenneri]|uniref:CBN-BTB-15 protein n=1 Tax=Caenorhabditis brenneri TaxID=135651 RepID=G0MD91_CAEBE|nr:CBN-BTB-15 protein [Caenorhabditis brenneri]
MVDKPITHRSTDVIPLEEDDVLEEEIYNNGVKSTWNGRTNENMINRHSAKITGFTLWWQFDWSELKETGVDEVSGHITVSSPEGWFPPHKINFNFVETTGKAETNIYIGARDYTCSVVYEYTLFPRRSSAQEVKIKEVFYEEMFFPSAKNDTILVVDGKKLHVNKAFLSYHSDFFNALFSSNFKEGRMDEIPIEDVTFEDFGLIMSTIYPMTTMYPNDNNVEKLLELADRFMLPSIIRHVEYHLIHHSKIDNAKMTWMADAYGMTELLEKCVLEYTTIEKVKKLKASEEYMKISENTKTKIFDRVFLYL